MVVSCSVSHQHARFRFDEVQQAWIVLAPERLLMPDEQAVEILRLIDGARDVNAIIDELVRRYEGPAPSHRRRRRRHAAGPGR
jgi:coenzyme PQQ biosynthesis protein PqqD